MRKLFAILFAAIFICLGSTQAFADEPVVEVVEEEVVAVDVIEETQYFKFGYRAQSENGYWYTSSTHNHVYVCEGHYMTTEKHARSTRCMPPRMQSYIDRILHKDHTVYWDIIDALKLLK